MYDTSLVLSTLAGAATVVGAILLFLRKSWGNRSLAFFLGLASGVMLAVVVFDILPSALYFGKITQLLLGFAWGVFLILTINRVMDNSHIDQNNLISLGYFIAIGIAFHDLPEGMAIALGEEMKERTAMAIALGIGLHNIPEGMAIAAPLIMGGMRKIKIIILLCFLALITPLGTILGKVMIYILPNMISFLLAFAGGIMTYLVFFQLWPEARKYNLQTRWWGFWLGVLIIFSVTFY